MMLFDSYSDEVKLNDNVIDFVRIHTYHCICELKLLVHNIQEILSKQEIVTT